MNISIINVYYKYISTILCNVFVLKIDHDYCEIDKHILKQRYIIKHTKIGEYSDYCVIAGVPAKVIKNIIQKQKIGKKFKLLKYE